MNEIKVGNRLARHCEQGMYFQIDRYVDSVRPLRFLAGIADLGGTSRILAGYKAASALRGEVVVDLVTLKQNYIEKVYK